MQPHSRVFEDSCLKLDTIASDIRGVSGRKSIQAILEGQEHRTDLAYKARSTRRGKMPSLRLALNGRINERHRCLLN